ncbi:MAG: hypothetical protein P8P56_10000 [Yoonia sp.]|nr:hypothetical protein [Yoonia sp.]MDG1862921.1 hypothetical protein [Yoonia sp.]
MRSTTTDDTFDGGQHNLSSRDAYYNEDGSLRNVTTFFDDGTISMNEYSFGQIQRIVMFDGGDVKPWSDVAITYGVKRPEGIQIHRI